MRVPPGTPREAIDPLKQLRGPLAIGLTGLVFLVGAGLALDAVTPVDPESATPEHGTLEVWAGRVDALRFQLGLLVVGAVVVLLTARPDLERPM